MISKAEHDLHVHGFYKRASSTVWSRIECPDCGLELCYDPTVVLMSYPSARRCFCMNNHIHTVTEPVAAHPYPEHKETT